MDVQTHVFLSTTLSGELHTSTTLILGNVSFCNRWIEGWMGPITDMDDMEKLVASRHGRFATGEIFIRCPLDRKLDSMEKSKFLLLLGLEIRRLGCRSRSQSLYRLGYPGSLHMSGKNYN
jgi:hypothetical protein